MISDLNQVLGLEKNPSNETERERMIRTGEMTPFGTTVMAESSHEKKTKVCVINTIVLCP